MNWNVYFLKYQLASPIHIGNLALGNVQKTKLYIPGKTLWGAATAILTYSHFRSPSFKDYQAVGEYVRQAVRFGYFFIEDDSDRSVPIWSSRGLRYGSKMKLTQEEMEFLFLYSEASTAIIKNQFAADPSTLHETEYVWPQNRNEENGTKSIYFSGYVYLCRQKSDILNFPNDIALLSQLKTLFIGANRRMGNGKLILQTSLIGIESEMIDQDPPRPSKLDRLFYHETEDDAFVIKEERSDKSIATADIVFNNKSSSNIINGIVKPLIEREWLPSMNGKCGAGQKLSDAVIAWEPGSIVKSNQTIVVGDFGRWQIF
ncbi:MAG: hypothetical protein SCK70_02585 [bacterium]|nr:hypothetical protein [bacterium]